MVLGLDSLGQSIPRDTPHAVSVSLPTWASNVGYEEGQSWVTGKMTTGYPRFFQHLTIQALAKRIAALNGRAGDSAILLPTPKSAQRCLSFMQTYQPENTPRPPQVYNYIAKNIQSSSEISRWSRLSAVIYPQEYAGLAKQFWQHTGEGISSRRAEFCQSLLDEGQLVEATVNGPRASKGPRRYQRSASHSNGHDESENHTNGVNDQSCFVEERFGRNLDLAMARQAKAVLRRRIAGSLTKDIGLDEAVQAAPDNSRLREVAGFSEDDVYLYPGGMNAIYNAHRMMLTTRGNLKSIMLGFPYVDTLKVLEKFGPGCLFYGSGANEDLDDLEARLKNGERYLALFCEFPGNPLLRSVDLARIRQLADQYDFGVVVDETIGNFLNVSVLPLADVMVSSLTKIFSGDSNVMGGAAILNPQGRYYNTGLKQSYETQYEDNYWPEDAIFMERNSRDFVSRIDRINGTAEAICDLLSADSRIKRVYYPKTSSTRPFYDQRRAANGGYGGLLSATFHSMEDAKIFYDSLDVEKGPSLGTNFTLASPFVLLAHYTELDWAAQFGVEASLVRFSVGLEDTVALLEKFKYALNAIRPV